MSWNGRLQLSDPDVAKTAYDTGLRGESLVHAVAIAFRESGGDAHAWCYNCFPGIKEDSRGLWQINVNAHPTYDRDSLFTPQYNAKAMYEISSGGTNFDAWSTNAGWESWRPRAEKAIADIGHATTSDWIQPLKDLIQKISDIITEQTKKPTNERIPWATEEPILEKMIDDFIVKYKDLPQAVKDILATFKKQMHDAANYGEGFNGVGDVQNALKAFLENIPDIPTPNDIVSGITDWLTTIGGTVLVVILGLGLILIGGYGLIGAKAPIPSTNPAGIANAVLLGNTSTVKNTGALTNGRRRRK